MTPVSTCPRAQSAEFGTDAHRSTLSGLVIENLDARPDSPVALWTLCAAPVTGSAGTVAVRPGA